MSTFKGIIKEYPFVSADRFDGMNLNSSIYLLSHCHEDHMVGLDSELLRQHIKDNNLNIYCSNVTKSLLLTDNRFELLQEHFIGFNVEQPQVIEAPGLDQHITITLIPASHCPGSVMFLIQGSNDAVLYTGDFRFIKSKCNSLKTLNSLSNTTKIKSLYIDTTFCIPTAYFIPSREECLHALKNIIKDWTQKGRIYKVQLCTSAKYGYEYVFKDLCKSFQCKIFCPYKSKYRRLPEIDALLTEDRDSTFIHSNLKLNAKYRKNWLQDSTDGLEESDKYLKITLSTLYFTAEAEPEKICQKISERHYRVCWSLHSSFSEVCEFVKMVKPENVFANVIPPGDVTEEQAEKRIIEKCFPVKEKKITFSGIGKIKKGGMKRISMKFREDDSDDELTWRSVIKRRTAAKALNAKMCN